MSNKLESGKMKYIKIFLIASSAILLAAGCNKTQPQANNQLPPQSPAAEQTASVTPLARPSAQKPPAQGTQTKQSAGEPSLNQNTIFVSQTVYPPDLNKPHDVVVENIQDVKAGETAFDLLNTTHKVVAKDYGPGMGEFVQSIDGIAPDSKHFWELYVNGKSSNTGASSYVLKNDDKIDWKLTAISSSGE